MFEASPSAGWRACQQVMHRIQPQTGQERRVLRRLSESGQQSIQDLRATVNTGEESLYATVSRLEGKGFAYAESANQIEITAAGREALELLAERGGATHR